MVFYEWPFQGGQFGLALLNEEGVPPVWSDYADWAKEAFPFEREVPLPPIPRKLPIVPVAVRLFRSEHSTSVNNDILDNFQDARAFWLEHACIDLRLVGNGVTVLRDEDESLLAPASSRAGLEAIHTRNAGWISVLYVDRFGPSSEKDFSGYALFRIPRQGYNSYGLVIKKRQPFVLTHELGHALGLPHIPTNTDKEADAEVLGMPFTSFCLQPFENDTRGLHIVLETANLMNGGQLKEGPQLSARWLSYAQVDRARLTVASRHCPYSLFDPNGVMVSGGSEALLDDIAGAFVAEAFAGDHDIRR